MARHHLAAALAALSLPAIAAPAVASPPAAAAPAGPPVEPAAAPDDPAAVPTEAPVEPAAAPDDPAAVPSSPGAVCGIRVVRAPADLRDQVEAQLEADGAACLGVLDVWLVPSSDGIHVQARDRAGRVRERLVPDATIAATLIASWVEIDAAAPLWAPPAPADVAPPSPPAPEPAPIVVAPPSQTTAAPRATAAVARPGVVASAPRRRSRVPGLSLSAMTVATGSEMSGAGVRVGVDLRRFGGFDLGLAAQASALDGSSRMFGDGDGTRRTMEHERNSGDLMATLRYTVRVGPLRLHPQLALGAGYAEHVVFIFYDRIYSYEAPVTTFGARAEAALGASLGLGRRWSIEALAGTGAATYTGKSEESGDRPPVWLDGINSALIGVRFTP